MSIPCFMAVLTSVLARATLVQTFSNFYARAQEKGALNFARIVQDWEDHTNLPPLFNLLALPGASVRFALRTLARICRCATINEQTVKQPLEDPSAGIGGRASSYDLLEDGEDGPDGAPTIDELCAAISETIERTFGSWDSTAQLINSAVKTMLTEMHELRDRMNEQAQKLGVERRRKTRPPTPVRKPAARLIGAEDTAPPATTYKPTISTGDVASEVGTRAAILPSAAIPIAAAPANAALVAAAPDAADAKLTAPAATIAIATDATASATTTLDRSLQTVPMINVPRLELPPRVMQKGGESAGAPVQVLPGRLPQWPPQTSEPTAELAKLPRRPSRPPSISDHVPSIVPSSKQEDLLEDQHLYES